MVSSGINITIGHRPKSVHLHQVADHFNFCSDIMSDHKNYCLLRVDCYASASGSVDCLEKRES